MRGLPEGGAWPRVAEIFRHAIGLSEEERGRFLDEACAGDPVLRSAVESLLDADERLGRDADSGFLSNSAAELAAPLVSAADAQAPLGRPLPERIGIHRILREIGRGGMGVVYLAERADGQFEERVALKLLKAGLDSAEFEARFLQERQILAWLRHPNIASLLDGGVAEDGRPYLVMEHVDGEPITDHCERRGLDVTERLQLFRQVCRGVQHAHVNLVVHRDLKPSNILVNASGAVKLLDFGVAKLLGDARTSLVTRTESRMLTPQYAAPEQILGAPVTTATDVYALGMVLHELLSGRRPYDVGEAHLGAADRVVLEFEPKRPSTIGLPKRLARRLAGDLDNIVLQALRRDPAARYATAAELEDDIVRHLESLPIRARPPGIAYRARKFLVRHRVAVTAAMFVVLSLLAGAGATLFQARATAREARKSEAVKDFLTGMFDVASPNVAKGEPITSRQMLDRAAERVDQELGGQPEIQAELLHVVGELYVTHGVYTKAESLLSRSLDLKESIFGEDDARLVDTLRKLATAYQAVGDLDAAEVHFRRAIDITRRRLGPEHEVVDQASNDLAILLREKGENDEAELFWREAVEARRRRLGDDHPEVATLYNNQAVFMVERGDFSEARRYYELALATRRRAFGDEHIAVANTISNIMVLERRLGNLDAAEPLAREALGIRRKLLGEEHPDVAVSLFNLAAIRHAKRDLEGAEPMYREAIGIFAKAVGDDHQDVAGMNNVFAKLVRERGQISEAETMTRDALAILERKLPAQHPLTATALLELGENLVEQRRLGEAEPVLRRALAIREEKLGPDNAITSEARLGLGICLGHLGRYAEAERQLVACDSTFRASYGEDDARSLRATAALAELRASAPR